MQIDSGPLVLQRGDTQLILDPGGGGAVREFNWRDRAIFRPRPAGARADPFAGGCFPMVPYANRIARGRFTFGTHAVQLGRNRPDEAYPLHGQGWNSSWAVLHATASSAALMFEGGADEWPWRYRSEQDFQLSHSALNVSLSVENLATSPMPVMLGLHPYFCEPGVARLQAGGGARLWLMDDTCLPIEEIATPAEWSFERAREITALPLDHCFVDWDCSAVVHWPDRRVDIRATNCRCLHVYAPSGRDFFCVEPQSAAVGALNRGAGEATVLAPGERFEIQVSFEVGAA